MTKPPPAGVSMRIVAMVAAAVPVLLAAETSEAAIKCRGAFQVSGGQTIGTPYCEDENLARVARSYGMRVSGSEVRRNPSTKVRVCQFVGHDARVTNACAGLRNDGDNRRWQR